jgi:hypothetical protein
MKFKVGDRVVVTNKKGCGNSYTGRCKPGSCQGATGTVHDDLENSSYTVELDKVTYNVGTYRCMYYASDLQLLNTKELI